MPLTCNVRSALAYFPQMLVTLHAFHFNVLECNYNSGLITDMCLKKTSASIVERLQNGQKPQILAR